MKIIIELELDEADVWATDPPAEVRISGTRNWGHMDVRTALQMTTGNTGGRVTSYRYFGESPDLT